VAEFGKNGIMAVQLSGEDKDQEFRMSVIREFSDPFSGIQMLISVDVLGRGFDEPKVEHIILARPLKKSLSTFMQQIGRGTRTYPGKEFCLIQDHSSNWLRFESAFMDVYENGVHKLSAKEDRKIRKEPTEKKKKEATCPKCHALFIGKQAFCLHCGHVRVVNAAVIVKPGEMKEIMIGGKLAAKDNAELWSQLCTVSMLSPPEKRLYRAKCLYAKILKVDKAAVNLPFDASGVEPTLATRNKVRQLNIAYYKGKK
jgi:superfamily II DNA or RNA helicase